METEAQRGEVAYVGKWQALHWNWGQTDTRACAHLKSNIASPLPLECPRCCPSEDRGERPNQEPELLGHVRAVMPQKVREKGQVQSPQGPFARVASDLSLEPGHSGKQKELLILMVGQSV